MSKFQEINLDELQDWHKASIINLAEQAECLGEQIRKGDEAGEHRSLEGIAYFQGARDAYAHVLRLAGAEVPK